MGSRRRSTKAPRPTKPGQVVATRGRRVVVRDEDGDRVCFLAGQRAVVGDLVQWVTARGEGGKLMSVEERKTALVRVDAKGKERVLAANLGGIVVVCAAQNPPFRVGLVDRYRVAAGVAGLNMLLAINKMDEGLPDEVEQELAVRQNQGLEVFRLSAHQGDGVNELAERLVDGGPWALVGHSGVGKTSMLAAWLPDGDVGAIGELSAYWGTGQHTTTSSQEFRLKTDARVVDSPGIRTFAPAGLTAATVRDHFPGVGRLQCLYRDCLHREGEDGCVAIDEVQAPILASYRRLLAEMVRIDDSKRPWRSGH